MSAGVVELIRKSEARDRFFAALIYESACSGKSYLGPSLQRADAVLVAARIRVPDSPESSIRRQRGMVKSRRKRRNQNSSLLGLMSVARLFPRGRFRFTVRFFFG